MTTTVKVHVNGQYRATVVHTVDGEVKDTVLVGPSEEKALAAYHGHTNSFTVTEESIPAEADEADEDEADDEDDEDE
ncbi:MAG TPA: hypothetical protein VF944_04400 [Candidatus Bathyarchaeia archaeon]